MRTLVKFLIVTLIGTSGAHAADLAVLPTTNAENFKQIDGLLAKVNELMEKRNIKIRSTEWSWADLESFHTKLFQTMALDPARLDSIYIPAELEPVALTAELAQDIERLASKRSVAAEYGAGEAFDTYIAQCREILTLRQRNLYSKARHIAKKGVLAEKFEELRQQVQTNAKPTIELAVTWNEGDRRMIYDSLDSIHAQLGEMGGRIKQTREIASVNQNRTGWLQTFFWALLPLFFLTGFIGGRLFKRKPDGTYLVGRDRFEPRV